VVTASGCVMFGSPLLRFWPRCQRLATWYAFSIWRRVEFSILGSLLRTIRSSGSSTGLYGLARCTPSRARRARTRLEEPERAGWPVFGRTAGAERSGGGEGLGRGCSGLSAG